MEKTILIAEAREDEIVVRTLGCYAAYEKPTDALQLVLKRRTETDDRELLAQAWQVANDKARGLGWIVVRMDAHEPRKRCHGEVSDHWTRTLNWRRNGCRNI